MQYGDFEYEIKNDEISLIKYHGLHTVVDIPDEIDGHDVTVIAKECFNKNECMKYIHFPKHLKRIEDSAFIDCSQLIELCFPNSSLIIETFSFNLCLSLKRIYIPQKVKYIAAGAFIGCIELKTIMVDENNENYMVIDDVLFEKNPYRLLKYPEGKKDKTYIVPHVHAIADHAFSANVYLKRILFPNTLYVIGSHAFSVTMIDKLTIPDSVAILGDSVFYLCDQLEKIVLSQNLKVINKDTFYRCTKLDSIVIPKSVEKLDCLAFEGCKDDLIIKVHSECYLKNKDRVELNFKIMEEK